MGSLEKSRTLIATEGPTLVLFSCLGVTGDRPVINRNTDILLPNGNLSGMPSQGVVETHFVLQRDEFVKARKLAVRNLPKKVKWGGWAQCGLLFVLMLTGLAYRPSGELQPVSLVVVVLV